ncbi:MAG: hypothetical protein WC517_01575 [Patescibacteria group bacterium]
MTQTANTQTTCTCQHPDDCCPACYQEKKNVLQSRLWEATLAVARLQQEALGLEQDFQLHRQSRGYRNHIIIQGEIYEQS